MAELKCTVETCCFNSNHNCCKGDIMVGGKHAMKSDDTSCESFCDHKRESFKNATEHPSKTIGIDCEADNCKYNNNYRCVAERVEIRGNSACTCKETACATFRSNCNC